MAYRDPCAEPDWDPSSKIWKAIAFGWLLGRTVPDPHSVICMESVPVSSQEQKVRKIVYFA